MNTTKNVDSGPVVDAGSTRPPPLSDATIKEMEAHADVRREEYFYGPRYHTCCPDCGATVDVVTLPNGRHELKFVKHAV
jgi:hypothetical protein